MSAIVTKDFVAGALTNFQAILNQHFVEGVKNWPLKELVTEVPSTADAENYNWLGDYPSFREFLGDAVFNDLKVNTFEIKNRKYESTIQVNEDTFMDDGARLKTIEPRVRAAADAAIRHRHKLLMELIVGNGNGYDGTTFFSNSHSERESGTNDNLLTGTGVTVAAVQTDFRAARAAMRKFKTDTGEHINGDMDLVVLAPPDLEGVFEELLEATVISNTTNTLKGAARLMISPYLETLTGGDANDWYLLNVAGEIKPFAYQDRMAPELRGVTDPTDSHVVKTGNFLWQSIYRGNVGFLLWQKAVKTTNT